MGEHSPPPVNELERYVIMHGWYEVPGGGKGSHKKFKHTEIGGAILLPHYKNRGKPVSYTVWGNTLNTLGQTRESYQEWKIRGGKKTNL